MQSTQKGQVTVTTVVPVMTIQSWLNDFLGDQKKSNPRDQVQIIKTSNNTHENKTDSSKSSLINTFSTYTVTNNMK